MTGVGRINCELNAIAGNTEDTRIRCVLIDEELVAPLIDSDMLRVTYPEELERIEFLFDGAMLRIYTREFIREMIGGGHELRKPVYVSMASPPFCA